MFPKDEHDDFFPSPEESGGGGGIPEAPIDGNTYGRLNGGWAVAGSAGWTLQKKISITGLIPVSTTITVNANGANHTVVGDAIDLGVDAPTFNTNLTLYIVLNGIYQEKGVDVIWVSNTSFNFNIPIDTPDIIIILAE